MKFFSSPFAQNVQVSKPKRFRRVAILNKRQKFIIAVLILSIGFFSPERFFGKSGIVFSVVISLVTELAILWAMFSDIRETKSYQIFVLPFFYSLSFSLFYFLTPQRFIASIIVTILYAIGLYSLFLSQNIFVVGSIRTIALLTGARIVSFILTLISYFFLINVIFSLHLFVVPTVLAVFIFTYFLLYHSLWTYSLEKSLTTSALWVLCLTLCICELSLLLWFWPSSPTVIALLLTGIFYIFAGLSHVWFDRRLFRNVLWEYTWVGSIVFIIFIFSTSWRGGS